MGSCVHDHPDLTRGRGRIRRAVRSIALAVSLVAVLGIPRPVPVGGQEGEDPSLQQQYDEVLGREARLVAELEATVRRRLTLAHELEGLERRLERAEADLAVAQRALDRTEAAEERARDRLERAEDRLRRATEVLKREAVESYIAGGDGGFELAALLDDPDHSASVEVYGTAIADHQREVVEDFKRARADRDRQAHEAGEARAAAANTREEFAATARSIDVAVEERTRLADEAASQQVTETQLLTELRGKKVMIEARVIAIERESDGIGLLLAGRQLTQPEWKAGVVKLVEPIPGVRASSGFGMRLHPILHIERLHAGIDLSAGSGRPIRAAGDGEVVVAGSRGGYGNTVVIDHGNSLGTLYAHQSSVAVRDGQRVKAGDVIGRVGSTGLSTGPHLHFETRIRGVPVDPKNFFTN